LAAIILYVEDDPIQRQLIAQMLEWGGYTVELAEDGREGVDKATSRLPDLIMMDLRLPRMDGYAAIKAIRSQAETAHIPILALSSLTGERDKKQAMDAGANAYFVKPIDLTQLLSILKTYLAED